MRFWNPEMEQEQIDSALRSHSLFIKGNIDGKRAIFRRVDLRNADFKNAELTNADLSFSNLQGANLFDTNLTGTDLRGANISYTNLFGAKLFDADFKNTNLKGSYLDAAKLLKIKNLPNISWIKPGCLVKLHKICIDFYLIYSKPERFNFIQDSVGLFIKDNHDKFNTFDLLINETLVSGVPMHLKYTALSPI